MSHTAWYVKDLDTNTVAMPYHYSDTLGRYIAYGHNGYPDYPAGTLRTSAEQFAHFLIAWTSNGIWQDRQVFDSTAIQKFTPNDVSLGSYTWFFFPAPSPPFPKLRVIYGPDGVDNGVSTFIGFEPRSQP